MAELASRARSGQYLYNGGRARVAAGLLEAQIGLASVTLAFVAFRLALLFAIRAGRDPSQGVWVLSNRLLQATGYLGLPLTVITAVCLLRWVYRASLNLAPLGASQQRFEPVWAVGYFLIPIYNLFRPYQIMKEIWAAGRPDRVAPDHALVGWWWGSFLAMGVLVRIEATMWGLAETVEQMITACCVGIVGYVVTIIAALIAIAMVQAVTRRQEEQAAALTDPSPVSEGPAAGDEATAKVQSGYLLAGIGAAVHALVRMMGHATWTPQDFVTAALNAGVIFALICGSQVLVIVGLARLTAGLFAKPELSVGAGSEAMPLSTEPGLGPAGGNALATAALVCGIASGPAPGLPAIAAIVYGSVALSRIRKSGGLLPGRGQALAGLILGAGGVLLPLVGLLWVFL